MKGSKSDLCTVVYSVDCFHLTSFCAICQQQKTNFQEGMSASKHFIIMKPNFLMLLVDRKMCPSLRDVNNLYEKWFI